MTKNWHTKKKILKLIGKKVKTPGEISSELGLAPSTVSEHLEGLERIGAIKKVDNPHIKKWKYYSLNPSFNIDAMNEKPNRMPFIAATLVIAIFLCAFAFMTFGMPAASAVNQVAFRLTDPPKVPNGTQALNITYSSIQAHLSGSGNESGWISGSGSGTIDLMGLINTSQVIGTGKIPDNASIDLVRFTISSAKIVVDNVTYNVTVPSGQLTASVTGSSRVNSSSSVLIDLSPVVAAIYTENSTVFVMVPSLRAVVIGGENASFRIGDKRPLNPGEVGVLNDTSSKISITGANLSVVGNSTQLEVTVKNNADENVTLEDVALFGTPSVFIAPNSIYPMRADANIGINVNARPDLYAFNDSSGMPGTITHQYAQGVGGGPVGSNWMQSGGQGGWNGEIGGVNVTTVGDWKDAMGGGMPNFTQGESQKLGDMVRIGVQARMFQALNFIVEKNGTLVLPLMSEMQGPMLPPVCENCFEPQSAGYVLMPGASATLKFSGNLLYADGQMRLTPINGSKYELIVSGDRGVEARVNVTAAGG